MAHVSNPTTPVADTEWWRVWDQPGLPGKSLYKTKPAKSDGSYTINFIRISSEDTVSKEEEEGEEEKEEEQ